ncbi:hypothetical protein NQ318_001332 [Aromia moschata]|uniref:Uncharacterized protein n=1 Tax=Aromia moschata TaxID=1265417 RepID=A0AAV8ZEV4_9CUCU|nr:hypothetical protein NQ318_001332 [Aromia moschata]
MSIFLIGGLAVEVNWFGIRKKLILFRSCGREYKKPRIHLKIIGKAPTFFVAPKIWKGEGGADPQYLRHWRISLNNNNNNNTHPIITPKSNPLGPLRDLCGKEWLLLLFAMAHWERLKIISVTHLLYSSEETQKTQNITKSRACAVGLASMHPHLYTSVLVVAYQALTEEARQLKIATPAGT